MMKRFFIFAPFVAMLWLVCSCGTKGEWRQCEGAVWATQYHITYFSDRDLSDSISRVFREVELSLSPFNPQSRISRINRGEDLTVDTLIERVTAISQEVCRRSGGAFDPTVSPLVNLWGFGYTGHPVDGALPSPTRSEIDSALAAVGIADCSIVDGRMVKKSPETSFNFSAVTKGLGCDLIGGMLRRNGCRDFMIEIGGEIALSGHNPRGKEWRIQIDAPIADDAMHRPMGIAEFTDCAIATSGNYRNFLTDSSGTNRGHTISPVTGMPVVSRLVSVTVVAPDCATADAYATACMASDPATAAAMINGRPDLKALFVMATSPTVTDPDSLYFNIIRFPPLK